MYCAHIFRLIASSNLSPADLIDVDKTTPPNDKTATSVVPPPISTTMDPVGSATGSPAPIAAATGSSIKNTLLAPAASADSRIARLSTFVEPEGTQITICGLENVPASMNFKNKMLYHLFSNFKISNNSIFHWSNRLNFPRSST